MIHFSQMKEGSHDHGDEQQSSKEITPEKDEVSKVVVAPEMFC